MKPHLLLIIDSDPRKYPRAAEAVRIAAGLGAWGGFALTLYLHGPALTLLGLEGEQMLDGDSYPQYLPVLRQMGHALRGEAGGSWPASLSEYGEGFSPMDMAEFRQLVSNSAWVLRF
jgi:hypothetical protein